MVFIVYNKLCVGPFYLIIRREEVKPKSIELLRGTHQGGLGPCLQMQYQGGWFNTPGGVHDIGKKRQQRGGTQAKVNSGQGHVGLRKTGNLFLIRVSRTQSIQLLQEPVPISLAPREGGLCVSREGWR